MAAKRHSFPSDRDILKASGIERDPLEVLVRDWGVKNLEIKKMEADIKKLKRELADLESRVPILQVLKTSLESTGSMRGAIPGSFLQEASNRAAGYTAIALGPSSLKEKPPSDLEGPLPQKGEIFKPRAPLPEERPLKRQREELSLEEIERRKARNRKVLEKRRAKKEKQSQQKDSSIEMPLVATEESLVSTEISIFETSLS